MQSVNLYQRFRMTNQAVFLPSFAQSVEKLLFSVIIIVVYYVNGNINPTERNIEPTSDFLSIKYQLLQIDIAIDELFGNITHYAYNPDIGPATVRVEVKENPLAVIVTFIDHGVQYDPLATEDPDTTLSAEERKIGGLGIYIVKKSMDEITYEYKDGQNILTIKKNI